MCSSLRTWLRAQPWPPRLRSRTKQLQSANRLKDEFLATLSHELRTPLNAVLGYARMLQSGAIAEEKIPQALEVIDRNAGSLAQIVEDVLDVSRIVSARRG
jgi:signal transduction histidine kinase